MVIDRSDPPPVIAGVDDSAGYDHGDPILYDPYTDELHELALCATFKKYVRISQTLIPTTPTTAAAATAEPKTPDSQRTDSSDDCPMSPFDPRAVYKVDYELSDTMHMVDSVHFTPVKPPAKHAIASAASKPTPTIIRRSSRKMLFH